MAAIIWNLVKFDLAVTYGMVAIWSAYRAPHRHGAGFFATIAISLTWPLGLAFAILKTIFQALTKKQSEAKE